MKQRWLLAGSILFAAALAWPAWRWFAGLGGVEKVMRRPEGSAITHTDHSDWDRFLKLVMVEGLVDYEAARRERGLLDVYLDQVAKVTLGNYDDEDKELALLINAYNAMVIQGVLDAWPIDSVRDAGWLRGFFRERRYRIAGVRVSLHGLESRLIRTYDPRAHFALNCASISCPPLRGEAYTAEKLDRQLEEVTRAFLTDHSENAFDPHENRWKLSKILKWYQEDFGGEQGVRELLARYHGELAMKGELTYRSYDWSLNTAPPLPEPAD